jgi:hypothetical protein
VFVPVKYPPSWIFESTKTGFIANGTASRVTAKYHAPVFSGDTITFSIFSEDGLYYTEHTEKMEIKKDEFPVTLKIIARLFLSPLLLPLI